MRKNRRVNRKKKGGSTLKKVGKWARIGGSVASTALTALKVANVARGLINAEFKFCDNNISYAASTPFDSSNPQVFDLTSAMAQGIGANQFTGQSVRLKSLFIRGRIAPSQNVAANTWATVRMLLLRDLNVDGTLPTVTDILQSNSWLSPLTTNMPDRYVIMSDKTYNASRTNQGVYNFKIFKRLNHHFKVSAASPTTDRSGRILILFVTDAPNPYGPFMDMFTRLRFVDN